MPGIAMSRIKHSVCETRFDARNSSARDNGLAWVDPNHMLENSINLVLLNTEQSAFSRGHFSPCLLVCAFRTSLPERKLLPRGMNRAHYLARRRHQVTPGIQAKPDQVPE